VVRLQMLDFFATTTKDEGVSAFEAHHGLTS
jgi:hypothetical protein